MIRWLNTPLSLTYEPPPRVESDPELPTLSVRVLTDAESIDNAHDE